jgi:hypothetical protein
VELYSEFSQDENKEIQTIVGRGIHEILTLVEKSGKSPFSYAEPFEKFVKHNE